MMEEAQQADCMIRIAWIPENGRGRIHWTIR